MKRPWAGTVGTLTTTAGSDGTTVGSATTTAGSDGTTVGSATTTAGTAGTVGTLTTTTGWVCPVPWHCDNDCWIRRYRWLSDYWEPPRVPLSTLTTTVGTSGTLGTLTTTAGSAGTVGTLTTTGGTTSGTVGSADSPPLDPPGPLARPLQPLQIAGTVGTATTTAGTATTTARSAGGAITTG